MHLTGERKTCGKWNRKNDFACSTNAQSARTKWVSRTSVCRQLCMMVAWYHRIVRCGWYLWTQLCIFGVVSCKRHGPMHNQMNVVTCPSEYISVHSDPVCQSTQIPLHAHPRSIQVKDTCYTVRHLSHCTVPCITLMVTTLTTTRCSLNVHY